MTQKNYLIILERVDELPRKNIYMEENIGFGSQLLYFTRFPKNLMFLAEV